MAKQARAPWTPQEDKILRIEWGDVSARTLREKLPGRSWIAIKLRATRLRLGSPAQGRISIAEAARRAGLSPKYFTQVLLARGVRIERHPGGFGAQTRRCPRYLVDPDDAEDAVAAHLDEQRGVESVAEAARRIGVAATTLRSALLRAQAIEIGTKGRSKRIRVQDVDAVVDRLRQEQER